MAILHETIMALPGINIKGVFDSPITGVSIDTRSLNAGELFVAFIGAQVDGHDFIPKAISRGASAVMASTTWDGCENWEAPIPLIMTEDPIKTLADLATSHRKRFDVPLIAITGTNGKTSTKNLLAHLLEQRYTVLNTTGNFNNHIGLPMTILNLDESHEIAVIEMGASQSGDIEYLCNIAQPNQGLITNISLAHTEFFHDEDTIQATKGELFKYLCGHGGRSFVNIDDERVVQLAENCPNPIHFGFSMVKERSYQIKGPDAQGCYEILFGKYAAHLPQPGKAIAFNAAAAITIALQNGLRFDQVSTALENYPGESGRMEHALIGGVHFFNDAYNSNPASVTAGFETMAEIITPARKILIFGDMLELGSMSHDLHTAAAEQMLAAGFDQIILVGHEVIATANKLVESDFKTFYHNPDKATTIQYFLDLIAPGDLVYLKGSRGMQLEAFIKAYKEVN
ncbi:MAG: UDP-N-acetylmuramoyl-tripeptide--D-alanyl-D-alanine ligase [Candidatus Marinimicrobia bacterium]|nr:UDP-N-acetylmuramoyl-tripeptide--D-alanyl-D-alanine ligase [Candidatus Neomarinimicrobiota bacterium]